MNRDAPNRSGRVSADDLLHHEGRVGADHHHLAMGHVDDAHGAEGDRKPDGSQQQDRAEGDSVPDVLERRSRERGWRQSPPKRRVPPRRCPAEASGGHVCKKRESVLVSEIAQGLDRRQRSAEVESRLIQNDRGACLDHRCLDAVVALLRRAPSSRAGRAAASRERKTAPAASSRLLGSGLRSVRVPSAASTARRTRLLTPDRFEGGGKRCVERLARRDILNAPVGSRMATFPPPANKRVARARPR